MEVAPGYKQTEVGVIPEEWKVRPLKSVSKRIMVGIASAATHAYREHGIVLLRNQNIKPGHLDDSDVLHVDRVYEMSFKSKRLKTGDLLTARTGYPGTTCVVPPEYESAQSFTTLITRPDRHVVDSGFLCHYLNSERGQGFFGRNQIGGGQKNVNAGSLQTMPVPVPTLAEQRAISEALSHADVLIESVERLLAKKRHIRQGATQELLTGRKRLPGFGGEWEVKRLGEVGRFAKGKGIRKDDVIANGLPCIRYGEIYTRYDDFVRLLHSFIPPGVARESWRLQRGDLLFAGSGETAGAIGKCVAYLGEEEAYAGGDIIILSPIDHDSMFLGYLLNHPSIAQQKARMGQGDAVVHISLGNLAHVELRLPPPREQTAIATVLSAMDTELTALEQQRDKARLLKQGMVQELLTGRIRLI